MSCTAKAPCLAVAHHLGPQLGSVLGGAVGEPIPTPSKPRVALCRVYAELKRSVLELEHLQIPQRRLHRQRQPQRRLRLHLQDFQRHPQQRHLLQ